MLQSRQINECDLNSLYIRLQVSREIFRVLKTQRVLIYSWTQYTTDKNSENKKKILLIAIGRTRGVFKGDSGTLEKNGLLCFDKN